MVRCLLERERERERRERGREREREKERVIQEGKNRKYLKSFYALSIRQAAM